MRETAFSFNCKLVMAPLRLTQICTAVNDCNVCHPLSVAGISPPIPNRHIFPRSVIHAIIRVVRDITLPNNNNIGTTVGNCHVTVGANATGGIKPSNHCVGGCVTCATNITPTDRPHFTLIIIVGSPRTNGCCNNTISTPIFNTVVNNMLHAVGVRPSTLAANSGGRFIVGRNRKANNESWFTQPSYSINTEHAFTDATESSAQRPYNYNKQSLYDYDESSNKQTSVCPTNSDTEYNYRCYENRE